MVTPSRRSSHPSLDTRVPDDGTLCSRRISQLRGNETGQMGAPVERKVWVSPNAPPDVIDWFSEASRKEEIAPLFVREWLAEVLRENYRLFYGIAYGYLRNSSSAEDVVQSAALKGLQRLRQLKRPETVVGWFASITRHTCLDLFRDKNHRVAESLDGAEPIVAPNAIDLARIDQQHLLLSEINKLPDNLAVVVRLRFLEDFDIVEIAEYLGLRRNTVEVRLHRALEKLAKSPRLQLLREKYL